MSNDDHWDFDRAFSRDNDREPSRQRERRPRSQLTSAGTLRTEHALAQLRKAGLL